MQPSRLIFAATMVALGVTGLVNGDFALVWQNVPLHRQPERNVIADACAILELAAGVGLWFKPALTSTCRFLFVYMALWLVWLEVPTAIHSPLDAGAWGSVGEIAIMTAGVWCLFAAHAGTWERQYLRSVVGSAGIRGARWLLVVALPLIGIEVIVDAVRMGDRIMQPWLQWLPHPAAWACLTGVGSMATCLAMLFGIWPRFAATMESVMLGAIAVTYWGPDLYTGRTATTAFIISFLIAAGVGLVASTYRSMPWFAARRPVWKA